MKKENILNKAIIILVLIVISLTSIFGVTKVATSGKIHKKTMESLDEKKATVMKLTAGAVISSAAFAAIPGDATTPLANQILKLSSYLLIVTATLFFEKIFISISGYITFTFLLPIACFLFGINLFKKNEFLKQLAIKLCIFGIIIVLIVPVSIKVSNLIEETNASNINQTIEDANNMEELTKESNEQEEQEKKGIISNIKEGIANAGDGVSKTIEKGKQILGRLVDSIAVLIITTCVIPIVVLFGLIWIFKMFFGLDCLGLKSKKSNGIKEKKCKENIIDT